MWRSALLAYCSLLALPAAARKKEGFEKEVTPIIHKFIWSNYHKFSESDLTMRDLKTHLMGWGWTKDFLKKEEIEDTIRDITDEVANNCNMGEVELDECKKRVGQLEVEDDKEEL